MDSLIGKMRANPIAFAVVIVIVIVIILWLYRGTGNMTALDEHMTGCWVAPDDFCESAEIGSMMCVFDEPKRGWNGGVAKREGYIVILPNGVKSPMYMDYVSCAPDGQHGCNIRANVTFDDGPDWGSEPVTINIDMLRGAMTITGELGGVKTVYARLYRQNDISDLVKGIVGTPTDKTSDSATIATDA